MATFILPFDHRSGFAKEIMETSYPFSPADRARAQELKQIIYDGFLEVFEDGRGSDVLGILVDEETGSRILQDAHHRGILDILTLEASGEPQLRLQYGEQSSQRIRMLGATLGKVLLRFSEKPQKNDRQLQTLQTVCAQLTRAGQRVLIELLSTGTEEKREDFLAHTIRVCGEMGIVPEFWKVESLPSISAWKHVKGTLHDSSGILLLGRGEDRAHVEDAVRTAAKSGVVDGFAIGRTLFANELRNIVAGKKKRPAAVHTVADNFRSMITLWKSV
jgi:5-dehydro-2-deoxygluconokinase